MSVVVSVVVVSLCCGARLTIAMDEPPIEVTKTQKGLNILNFTRFWPVQNDLNLILGHAESVGGDNKAEVLDTIFVELAFRGRGVKTVFA